MKKNATDEIIPPKKSIRDIEPPSKSRGVVKAHRHLHKEDPFIRPVAIKNSLNEKDSHVEYDPIKESYEAGSLTEESTPSKHKYSYHLPKKSKKKIYIAIALCVIPLSIIIFTSFFKSAVVTVSPMEETKTLSDTFIAKKDVTSNGLGYQLVTVTKDLEKAVDPKDITSEKKVDIKASGVIVIYNSYDTNPQKLVANTRFQTSEGLIFRLVSPVTVPGKTVKDGKTVPGSVEAQVVADRSGTEYNIGLKDFTIPGLKTDPARYKAIYARSKTEMTGGFSGVQKLLTKDVLSKSEQEMESSIKSTLSKDIMIQIPSDYVLYPSSLYFKFDPAITATGSTGTTVIKKRGVATAVILDKKTLSKAIITKLSPEANSDLVKITNLDNIDFTLATSTSINNATSINFTLKGDVHLVWIIDEVKLKNDLLGLSKSNANTVMSSYPSIKEAWVLTKPFWNTKIPTDPKKVKVVNTFTQ